MIKCNKGTTALEFALVAPILFFIIFAIIEFSLVQWVSSIVEGGTTHAARQARTGSERPAADKQQEYIAGFILERGAGLISADNLDVTILSNNVDNPLGGGGEIVKYRVSYNWHIATPFIRNVLGLADDEPYVIRSSAVVVNEPFMGE